MQGLSHNSSADIPKIVYTFGVCATDVIVWCAAKRLQLNADKKVCFYQLRRLRSVRRWLVMSQHNSPQLSFCRDLTTATPPRGPSGFNVGTLRVPHQSDASSSPSFSPSSGSGPPATVIDISHGVFHSRLKTLFLKLLLFIAITPCSGSSAGI